MADDPRDPLQGQELTAYLDGQADGYRLGYERAFAEKAAIIEVLSKFAPLALPHNDLPTIVRGIALQRDNQHELKDHLADVARRLTEDQKADPLRALLAVEDRAVDQITEAMNRHEYGLLREGVIALGRTPLPFDQLSERTKRLRANQLRGHVEFVLAALREVAGL